MYLFVPHTAHTVIHLSTPLILVCNPPMPWSLWSKLPSSSIPLSGISFGLVHILSWVSDIRCSASKTHFFRLYGTGHFRGTEHVDKYVLFLEHLGKEENTMEWLVGGIPTPLKNMSSSVGTILPNIGQVIKVMFQTTNHMRIVTPNKKKRWSSRWGFTICQTSMLSGIGNMQPESLYTIYGIYNTSNSPSKSTI